MIVILGLVEPLWGTLSWYINTIVNKIGLKFWPYSNARRFLPGRERDLVIREPTILSCLWHGFAASIKNVTLMFADSAPSTSPWPDVIGEEYNALCARKEAHLEELSSQVTMSRDFFKRHCEILQSIISEIDPSLVATSRCNKSRAVFPQL